MVFATNRAEHVELYDVYDMLRSTEVRVDRPEKPNPHGTRAPTNQLPRLGMRKSK